MSAPRSFRQAVEDRGVTLTGRTYRRTGRDGEWEILDERGRVVGHMYDVTEAQREQLRKDVAEIRAAHRRAVAKPKAKSTENPAVCGTDPERETDV